MNQVGKKRILIIEDAEGITKGYKVILEKEGYETNVCVSGEDAKLRIEKGQKYDLAIVDLVLPTENPEKRTLKDCEETGLRLIKRMIDKNTCRRFYVITVRNSLKKRVERLCKSKKTALTFEHKLDYEPEHLASKTLRLLDKQI
ncbi:MAG: response regulator [Sedimentisphaerales bacterium]|jgi:DNA-binding response OmpR family regulator